MIYLIILLLPIIWILGKYIYCIFNLRHYPPGPFPLPIIGNIHLMSSAPTEKLRDLAKVYGNVFSLSFGTNRVVILNTIEPIRKALITKSSQFAGRPLIPSVKVGRRSDKGVIMSDYNRYWKTTRKLSHSALKMFGDGLGKIEEKVVGESEALHQRVDSIGGKPVDINHELGLAVMNIICSMVFGHRYHRNDPEFEQLLEANVLIIEGSRQGNPSRYIPLLRYLPLFDTQKKLVKGITIRDTIVRKKVKEHIDSYDADNIRDFTDSLIRYSTDPEVLADSEGIKITSEDLMMIICDIFLAGAETTYTTLKWCILYLLHYPQYQEMMYDEIKREVGLDRYPELKDRSSLPLFQSVLQEVLRLSSIAELGLIHKATEDATIGGQTIPKGTGILMNLWYAHHDERYWENPQEFNPNRWLDDEKRFTPGKNKSFLPFSAGRRSCLGESLAKTELFLFFSRMVRDYKFEMNLEEGVPSLERQHGVVTTPKPYTVIFVPR